MLVTTDEHAIGIVPKQKTIEENGRKGIGESSRLSVNGVEVLTAIQTACNRSALDRVVTLDVETYLAGKKASWSDFGTRRRKSSRSNTSSL